MRLNVTLSERSINAAINQLRSYQKSLDAKCEMFVRRLADIGITEAMRVLAFDGVGDAPRGADFAVYVTNEGKATRAMMVVSGEGILFWEFGAGIEYNNGAAHPKAGALGMGVGTYPGQTHVPDPGYWYYTDETGQSVRSVGTQATMPMYRASVEMFTKIYAIAREVFKDGK